MLFNEYFVQIHTKIWLADCKSGPGKVQAENVFKDVPMTNIFQESFVLQIRRIQYSDNFILEHAGFLDFVRMVMENGVTSLVLAGTRCISLISESGAF